MFSLKKMTLQKVLIDNSVKYILQNELTRERDNKPNMIKNISFPKTPTKKFSQNYKKFNEDYITGGGFKILK